jgi:hypothetical protein
MHTSKKKEKEREEESIWGFFFCDICMVKKEHIFSYLLDRMNHMRREGKKND